MTPEKFAENAQRVALLAGRNIVEVIARALVIESTAQTDSDNVHLKINEILHSDGSTNNYEVIIKKIS